MEPNSSGKEGKKNRIFYIIICVLVVILIVMLCLKLFVFKRFEVHQQSMEPNYHPGDKIWVNMLSNVTYNDVVVFEKNETLYIKRVVAFGGDSVKIERTSDGVYKLFLKKKGEAEFVEQDEPFINSEMLSSSSFSVTEVHDGCCFVLGDNRNNSVDSRSFGEISLDLIIGKVI